MNDYRIEYKFIKREKLNVYWVFDDFNLISAIMNINNLFYNFPIDR
jgi:hypothetical protein